MPKLKSGKSYELPTKDALAESEPGCHICSQRRVKCDGARPACNKCTAKGLECSGYGLRYRFNDGLAARGKLKGRAPAFDDELKRPGVSEQHPLPDLVWADTFVSPQQSPAPQHDSSSAMFNPLSDDLALTPSDLLLSDINPFDPDGQEGGLEESGDEQSSLMILNSDDFSPHYLAQGYTDSSLVISPPAPAVPRYLEALSPQHRDFFSHFSESVAPVMVVLDGKFNGYRDLILPIAYEDDLVKAAVSVVSMYHLAAQRPELQHRADSGLQSIIRNLRHRADPTSSNANLLDLSAWTTIVVLLTGETVTGGSNLPILFRLLQHLAAANTSGGQESAMHAFLKEQTRMMTLFAQPLLGEVSGASTLSAHDKYFDFISNAAVFFPSLAPQIALYKAAIRSACNIYLTRVTKAPPHSETVPVLEELKDLCLNIQPGQPGHHALVWAYFIAAAESSTFEHRNFFTLRLQEVYSWTKFHNIPTALAALQELWKIQGERRWTEVLPEVMPVFII